MYICIEYVTNIFSTMKKVILFYSYLIFTPFMAIQAQTSPADYCSMVEEGKIWKIQVGGIKENVYVNHIIGDTLINGEVWKKVYNCVEWQRGTEKTYYAAIRDVGTKVYAIAKGSATPRLLYDFNLQVGDEVRCGIEANVFACLLDTDEEPDDMLGFPFKAYLRVENIEIVNTRGKERRRITLALLDSFKEPISKGNKVIWIEGIGSGAGPFLPWSPQPESGIVIDCQVNPTAISSPYLTIDADGSVFSLQGKHLNNIITKGIYIQNGKKIVIK